MTPEQALRAQIQKNERILTLVEANDNPAIKVTAEGQAMKAAELRAINRGLRAALERIEHPEPRRRPMVGLLHRRPTG